MARDRKILYASSITLLLVLLGVLFLPGNIGRTMTALLLVVSAVAIFFFVRKRPSLSINKNAVLLIMFAMGAVCLVLYYLTGVHFGFYKSSTPFSIGRFSTNLLLVAAIIFATEFIRTILLAQDAKFMGFFAYIAGVLSDLLLCGGFSQVERLSDFLEVIGLTLFPAMVSHVFYNYLCKRYGMLPSAVFRLVLALPLYLMPVIPALDEAIYSFFLMIIPLFAWSFVDLLYEKKKKYASRKGGVWSVVTLVVTLVMTAAVILLVTGNLRYKFIVIATPSMTGSINKGDAIIYEEYDGSQVITEDTVVVFTKGDDDLIIHRVVDIQKRNGVDYYTTKGDANKSADTGAITSENIRGVVLFRLPNLGQPTLFLRDLF